LVPARLVPAAVALDHRSGDPVGRVDETGGEASLHAEHAEARAVPGRIVGHQREAAVVAHLQLDPAAHAAVGAGGRDRPGDLARRFLGRRHARRGRGHALAARRAHRRGHRPVAEDADLGGVAAAQKRDGPDLLDVVARDGAAAAEDAGVAVEDEERLARVLVVGVQRRPRGLEPAVAGGGVAELPETIPGCSCEGGYAPLVLPRAGRQHRERQVEHHRAHAHDLGMLRVHDHAVARGQVTGGRRPAVPLDVDETRATRAERRAIGILAELWQRAGKAAASPSATTPPVPGLTAPRGISGSSNWRGWTTLPDGPPITAAPTGVSPPPPTSSISVRSVQPTSISTTPGRLRFPERPNSFVPRPPPSAAKAAPPRATIGTTAKSVSTLLMAVGLPKSPDSTGKGGRVRGIARWPSSDSSSAVSSPSTKPPAPRRISTPSDSSEPSTRSPISPH